MYLWRCGAMPPGWKPPAHRCGPGSSSQHGIPPCNCYRALQRHDTLPLTDELAATIADLPADPAGDAADELAVLVAALEPPDREIFLRKYYLMQSSREIAAALDLRVSTVNTRLSRGRDRLRRQLQERGYTHG